MSVFAAADVKSTNKPAALLEIAELLSSSEQLVTPEPPNNVTVSIDFEDKQATITATLPITYDTDNTGKIVITAQDYLP